MGAFISFEAPPNFFYRSFYQDQAPPPPLSKNLKLTEKQPHSKNLKLNLKTKINLTPTS